MKPLNLTSYADGEFASGVIYYEEQQPGLGDKFINDVEEALQAVVENPHAFGHYDEKIRYKLVRRFSHVIYYQEMPGEIVVLSIGHTSRLPGHWKSGGS